MEEEIELMGFDAWWETLRLIRRLTASTYLLELETYIEWLQSLSQADREAALTVSRPDAEDTVPSLLTSPKGPVAAMQSVLMRGILLVASNATVFGHTRCRQDREQRWRQQATLQRQVEEATYGWSRSWRHPEADEYEAQRHAFFIPLVSGLTRLSDLCGLRFLSSYLMHMAPRQ
ncbi:hypothetical protein KIPB_004921 [Kipferlia bialata]|uniref:Uncharacterized protein n=1 Tax=Kipferlia bialata TaxID=797122 RepID=A0A9K3GIM2_9EUKA|nr:hypothetical protein KIPB_004921 [Kipferlia bialata]|eukprot:g4921.t1